MNYRVAVLTLSDKGARGVRKDRSGPAVAELVCAAGFEVVYQKLLSDDLEAMQAELARLCDEHVCDLLLTTGGTGFSSRDVTPEATLAVAERQANGIAEAMRWHSLTITPQFAWFRKSGAGASFLSPAGAAPCPGYPDGAGKRMRR